MASKKLINISNLQKFLSKLNEKFALKKTMKGISEDAEGNIIIGEEGLVPAPNENSKGKFLRSDGEWALPSETAVYDSMTIEEGVAGVSEVDKVLNAKNLKQIVNSDGFLTSLDSSKLTGVINIENLPQGALERILIVSSKEERLTLLDTEVQLGDVVKEADTGLMYYVINTEKLNSEEGYTQFTAGSASSVPWSGVTDKPTIPTKTSDLTNDSDFAIDSNVVHTSGNETINGTKTFTSGPWVVNNHNTTGYSIKNTALARNDIPTEYQHYTFRAYDKNNNIMGEYCIEKTTYGEAVLNMGVRSEDSSGTQIAYGMQFRMTNDGSLVRFLPSANNKVHLGDPNAKWLKVHSDDVVHTSGTENISGNKVFRDTLFRKSDITTSTADIVYRFEDSNNSSCGYIQNNVHYWQNNLSNRHLAHNNTSGKDMYFEVLSHNDGSGVVNTGGSVTNNENLTTVTNATENSYVATMGWVNNPETSTNVVHRSGNETIAGNKTFSNQMYLGAGGTNYGLISAKDNNSILRLFGGTSPSTGANLDLYGEGLSSGGFSLRARTSSKIIGLDGSIDGTLKWNEKNVAREDNLCSMFANAIRFGGVGCIKLLAFEWDGYNTNAYGLQEGTSFSGADLRHIVESISGLSTIPSGSDTIKKYPAGFYLGTRPTGTWSLLSSFGAFNRSYHPEVCIGLFVRIV